jgi:transcriptional regulator with PAS, ATPase and Fis domain
MEVVEEIMERNNMGNLKRKPKILNSEDTNQFLKLTTNIEADNEEWTSGLNVLTKKIKKNYELEKINLNAFTQLKNKQVKFFIEKPLYAGNAYLKLLEISIIFTEGNTRKFFFYKYENHVMSLAEELEINFKKTKNIDSLNGAILLLHDMALFVSVLEDNQRLVKVFRYFFNLITKSKFKNLHQLITSGRLVNRFPEVLTKHLNEGLLQFESVQKIFGSHPALIETFLLALTYANDDEPCLIIGETGTGKENIAKILHYFSNRSENNFQTRNCGNFTATLFNSELQGAHWSAATDVGTQLGGFLAACGRTENKVDLGYALTKPKKNGRQKITFRQTISNYTQNPTEKNLNKFKGTVFLDEINSLPLELQSKLLRIIGQKEVQVLGEIKPRKFNAKVICATNQDPRNDIEGTILRRDLYYRVSRGIIEIPPLRKMKESIPDLALHLIKNDAMNIGLGKKARGLVKLDDEVLDMLTNYDWPGNVRELENVLYRALKQMRIDKTFLLKPHHFDLKQTGQIDLKVSENKDTALKVENWTDVKFVEHETLYMKELFHKADKNVLKASKIAGCGRTMIKNRWDKLGLKKHP